VRIAWVIYGELEQQTGGYVYDRLVIDGLRQRGHELLLYSLSAENSGHNARVGWQLLRGRADVVVADELCHRQIPKLFAALALYPRSAPARVLLVHHLQQWEDGRLRRSEWLSQRLAHRVVVTSRTSAERLCRSRAVDPWVCLPGSDRLELCPRPARAARCELLFVGTWTPRKGLLELLAALVQFSALDFRLTVAGDSACDRDYTARVEQLLGEHPALRRRVELLGVVDDARLARLYALADVLVAPTRFEGYGMALSEALRAGVAVLVTDVGAVREAVGSGAHVVLVEEPGPVELAKALGPLLEQPERRARMQRATESCGHPTWSQTVDCFERCLLELA
jgi:glycosyltransferase involved in cell wall biosynthesis